MDLEAEDDETPHEDAQRGAIETRPDRRASSLRLTGLVLVVALLVFFSSAISDSVTAFLARQDDGMMVKIIALALLAYVVTMTMPFMPGVEIGLALLTAFGAVVAPFVWLATVTALGLAFAIGRFVPCAVTARWLSALGLRRGAALVRRLGDTPSQDAAAFIEARTDQPLIRRLIRHRYLAIAILFNLPGNFVIGGGGGIALAAGLSRAFHPGLFLATVALATSPVPLAFFFGTR